MLGLVDVVLLAWLVSTYLRLRRRLAVIAATVTVDAPSGDVTGPDERDGRAGAAGAVVSTGVVRGGHLVAMFAIIEIDADSATIRSRPRWLGLEVVVPRRDVEVARAVTKKSGQPDFFIFEPVPGRAVGLERLRILLRRDPVGFRRRLIRLGWMPEPDARRRPRRGPDATLGSAG